MNIVVISAVFPPEPVVSANISYDLASGLSGKHEVTVISPAPTRPMGYDFSGASPTNGTFKHIALKSFTHPKSGFIGRFCESYSFGKASARYIATHRNEIDLIYMNTWPIFGQYFAIKAARKLDIPIVLHIQDIYPEAFTQKLPIGLKQLAHQFLFPIERFILGNCSRIVTISNGMKELLIRSRNVPKEKISVVYNWQDESRFFVNGGNEKKRQSETQTHFMFLGSLGPIANVDNLIRAFSKAKKANCLLSIAGEGSEKANLTKLTVALKEIRIKFINAPVSKAGKIQSEATVLLLSLKKGAAGLALPSKLTAYMFSAKPIIASVDQDSDTANAIKEAGCGWVVEPDNPSVLASLMDMVAAMPKEELREMGMKGRQYALDHFSKSTNLSKLVAVIENALY